MASTGAPLIPPPTHINDTHKVYSIAAWCIALGVVAGLPVIWRLGLRYKTSSFGADDYAIIPALLLYLGWTAMAAYVNLHAGVGKPLWEITVGEFSVWFKGILGSAWLYPAMTVSIRISILLFYRRIFAVGNSRIRYPIYFLLALQALYLVVYSILPAFICRPLYKAWHPLERQRYFGDWYYYHTQVALFSTSMAFDTILLVFPLYPVFRLQMLLKKRIGISIIFMLGAAASIAAAYKLSIFVIEMRRYYRINPQWLHYEMSGLVPPQFDTYGTSFWIPSQVEPAVALIGTSLPAIRQPLVSFSKSFRSILSSSWGKSRSGPSTSGQTERGGKSGSDSQRSASHGSEVELRAEYEHIEGRKETRWSDEGGI